MLSIKFGYGLPADLALALAAATFSALIFADFFFGFGVSQTGLFATLFLRNDYGNSLLLR
jgi:hypothetical protein